MLLESFNCFIVCLTLPTLFSILCPDFAIPSKLDDRKQALAQENKFISGARSWGGGCVVGDCNLNMARHLHIFATAKRACSLYEVQMPEGKVICGGPKIWPVVAQVGRSW